MIFLCFVEDAAEMFFFSLCGCVCSAHVQTEGVSRSHTVRNVTQLIHESHAPTEPAYFQVPPLNISA